MNDACVLYNQSFNWRFCGSETRSRDRAQARRPDGAAGYSETQLGLLKRLHFWQKVSELPTTEEEFTKSSLLLKFLNFIWNN